MGLPNSIAVLTPAEGVVGAVRQVDVDGIAPWVPVEVVQGQTCSFENAPKAFLPTLCPILLLLREIAGSSNQ
jgi:hypothetical protein